MVSRHGGEYCSRFHHFPAQRGVEERHRAPGYKLEISEAFLLLISTMGLIHAFFKAYYEMLERAGFIEHVLIVVLFGISLSVVAALLFAAVVVLIFGFCSWWADAGDAAAAAEEPAAPEVPVVGEGPAAVEEHAMVEEQVAAPVEEVADLPAGGEQAARAVCRRRAARNSALSEPGSSSGDVRELERE
jgi:hypothetical protein